VEQTVHSGCAGCSFCAPKHTDEAEKTVSAQNIISLGVYILASVLKRSNNFLSNIQIFFKKAVNQLK